MRVSRVVVNFLDLTYMKGCVASNTPIPTHNVIKSNRVSGLVVKSIVAIDGPRVRFAADAIFSLVVAYPFRLLKLFNEVIQNNALSATIPVFHFVANRSSTCVPLCPVYNAPSHARPTPEDHPPSVYISSSPTAR